ncbi:MAG: nickel pincer cofactor biosynthesis protein LarC [Myxococcales bacterium]|nr:nickel pincer cofactor biosynthesis protein LarC [Myxococcales bacterium]
MRILYLEPVGGIAGDMFLAAALDLGVPLADLEGPLHSLKVPGWHFAVKKDERHHLAGTHVDVVVDEKEEHPHRSWADIDALIGGSSLSAGAKEKARRVFRLIGEVEARVHGTTLEALHFHEVGAVDSIVDICGAAVVLELLGDPKVYASSPPLGGGSIRIAHGTVPVPVPATLELVKDLPVRFEGQGEMTTPTGAALLKAFATVAPPPQVVVEKVGYGVGTKDWPDRANVLRATLGRAVEASSALEVLECNLDDCSPQVLGALVDTLLARGALDAWISPVVMKKGRPGHLVGVLAPASVKARLVDALLEETTTLGVRATAVSRTELARRHETVETPWGPVRVKLGLRGETVLNATPEFEDCRALAEKAGVPLKQVQQAALAAWGQRR